MLGCVPSLCLDGAVAEPDATDLYQVSRHHVPRITDNIEPLAQLFYNEAIVFDTTDTAAILSFPADGVRPHPSCRNRLKWAGMQVAVKASGSQQHGSTRCRQR